MELLEGETLHVVWLVWNLHSFNHYSIVFGMLRLQNTLQWFDLSHFQLFFSIFFGYAVDLYIP
jgi:hypothetical protein